MKKGMNVKKTRQKRRKTVKNTVVEQNSTTVNRVPFTVYRKLF
jgi:hypothetical protein